MQQLQVGIGSVRMSASGGLQSARNIVVASSVSKSVAGELWLRRNAQSQSGTQKYTILTAILLMYQHCPTNAAELPAAVHSRSIVHHHLSLDRFSRQRG